MAEIDGKIIGILPTEVEIKTVPLPGYSTMEEGEILVGVSTKISEELVSEGIARDIVRRIQALRKEASFDIDDHIETYYGGDKEIREVFEAEADYIASETLSDSLKGEDPPKEAYRGDFEIDGLDLRLALVRIEK